MTIYENESVVDYREEMLRLEKSLRRGVEENLQVVRDGFLQTNEIVRGLLGPSVSIDEMALLFTTRSLALAFTRELVKFEGYELFNAASDLVSTSPIHSHYCVDYLFIRTPFSYRMEIMSVREGFSPIHSVYSGMDAKNGYKIHASFKCPDQEAYGNACATLIRDGFECAQKCESDYGLFSYFSDRDRTTWFIKPRVNLRDMS